MIDVQLSTTVGRSLMGIALGAMTYQANAKKNLLSLIKQETSTIARLQSERDAWTTVSTDLTTRMLDKRFKDPTFKKSNTIEDRKLQFVAKQNMLKARTRYDETVSKFNKNKIDQKVKGSFKLINLKSIL